MMLIETLDSNLECLEEHKGRGEDYSTLGTSCLDKIRAKLEENQNKFCAYCEKSISKTIFIEHYEARGTTEGNKLELELSNLLGVCSGKIYTNLRKYKNDHIEHCDTSRKSKHLSIDPRNPSHISTLYFNSEAKLLSTNGKLNNDFEVILNLNNDIICERRAKAYTDALNNLVYNKQKLGMQFIPLIENALKEIHKHKYEYTSFLRFQFRNLYKRHGS